METTNHLKDVFGGQHMRYFITHYVRRLSRTMM